MSTPEDVALGRQCVVLVIAAALAGLSIIASKLGWI